MSDRRFTADDYRNLAVVIDKLSSPAANSGLARRSITLPNSEIEIVLSALALAASPSPPAPEGQLPWDVLLRGRDDFIVERGLWPDFCEWLRQRPALSVPRPITSGEGTTDDDAYPEFRSPAPEGVRAEVVSYPKPDTTPEEIDALHIAAIDYLNAGGKL